MINCKIKIGYAGMTHLGLNYAIAGASKGFQIVGYDPDAQITTRLNNRDLTIVEPGLSELLQANEQNIEFSSAANCLEGCDIVYVAPDIVTDGNGHSDISYINTLIKEVIKNLSPTAILIILSQVPPGFSRQINFPKEKLYYQVETLIFGQAVQRALYPERFIVGCANPNKPINSKLQAYLEAFNCPILSMQYESAELCKISINCCLVASISVANSLSEICENIGADWNEIIPALRLDKRIGPHAYLQPGLGLAGGNLERDLATIINFANEHGTDKQVIQSFRNNSAHRKNWTLKTLFNKLLTHDRNAKIAVLGLTYKENTHSLKNSPAIQLLSALGNYDVIAYDPVIKELPGNHNVKIAASITDAATDADALVIMTPWQEFKDANYTQLMQIMHKQIIIDPFKVVAKNQLVGSNCKYFTLGAVEGELQPC